MGKPIMAKTDYAEYPVIAYVDAGLDAITMGSVYFKPKEAFVRVIHKDGTIGAISHLEVLNFDDLPEVLPQINN